MVMMRRPCRRPFLYRVSSSVQRVWDRVRGCSRNRREKNGLRVEVKYDFRKKRDVGGKG